MSSQQLLFKKRHLSLKEDVFFMVPGRGLEPPHLAAHPPQGCVYTNFTTRAYVTERTHHGFNAWAL